MKCHCQNCNQHLDFDPANEGTTIACPACGIETKLFIPGSITKPQKKRSRLRTYLIASAVMLLLVIAAVAVKWFKGLPAATQHEIIRTGFALAIFVVMIVIACAITHAKAWTRTICLGMIATGAPFALNGGAGIISSFFQDSSLAAGISYLMHGGQLAAGLVVIALALILWNLNRLVSLQDKTSTPPPTRS